MIILLVSHATGILSLGLTTISWEWPLEVMSTCAIMSDSHALHSEWQTLKKAPEYDILAIKASEATAQLFCTTAVQHWVAITTWEYYSHNKLIKTATQGWTAVRSKQMLRRWSFHPSRGIRCMVASLQMIRSSSCIVSFESAGGSLIRLRSCEKLRIRWWDSSSLILLSWLAHPSFQNMGQRGRLTHERQHCAHCLSHDNSAVPKYSYNIKKIAVMFPSIM